MPIIAAIGTLKRFGGGILAYMLALPLAVALAALIVSVDGKLGKAIWLRSKNFSRGLKNAVGLALFVFQSVWIVAGLISGASLAKFLVNRFAR